MYNLQKLAQGLIPSYWTAGSKSLTSKAFCRLSLKAPSNNVLKYGQRDVTTAFPLSKVHGHLSKGNHRPCVHTFFPWQAWLRSRDRKQSLHLQNLAYPLDALMRPTHREMRVTWKCGGRYWFKRGSFFSYIHTLTQCMESRNMKQSSQSKSTRFQRWHTRIPCKVHQPLNVVRSNFQMIRV